MTGEPGVGRVRLNHETLARLFGLPINHRVIKVEQHEDPTELILTIESPDFPEGENSPTVISRFENGRLLVDYSWPSRHGVEVHIDPPTSAAAAAASIVSELQRSKRGRR